VGVVVPWMMSVPLLQGVVLEGVEHQQTTDVVCLLMIMDSWQLAVFLWNKKTHINLRHKKYMKTLVSPLLIFFCCCFFGVLTPLDNISAISWQPVLMVEEAGVPGENHRPWASN
jgi:hypothetical protein